MTDALVLHNVTRRLGKFTLGPLDLSVPRGAVTALVGRNGAGKTTTLDLTMGMGLADGGSVEVVGLPMPADEVAIKARVAYVSPDLNFAPWGKVGRALDFIAGFYPDWQDVRCEDLLRRFGLRREERITALSFGARIKLALVMALARNAELLILDEPTVGLDVEARRLLFAEILDFVRREDRAVVISSHQLSDLERLADYVAIIEEGRLLLFAPMNALVNRFVLLDASMGAGALPAVPGIRMLERKDGRLRLLLDRDAGTARDLHDAGITVLAEVPMTLEEIFIALTGKAS
jgi:ABC-2 type transport system ATP-binding protein